MTDFQGVIPSFESVESKKLLHRVMPDSVSLRINPVSTPDHAPRLH